MQLNPITIGQPHSHTSVYILDDQLQECSTEEKGEIFVGGAGLAEGYLNQPLLTDQKFLLIALPGQQPKRLYRTGDLGRYLPDGNLEFLGRKEYQTKVCGMQVELGEIEHLICQYPTVKESIVIVVQKEKLLAFYTSTSSSTIQNELRKYLANRLPLFKLPSSYMQLENFPRTLNGKIERNPAVILASIGR